MSALSVEVTIAGDTTVSPAEAELKLMVTGVAINYGVNMIPFVVVDLPQSAMENFCSFDKFRRRDASVSIKTDRGCLFFDGWVDGLSFSQSYGNMSAQLVIKHKAQILIDVYPKSPGLAPGYDDYLTRQWMVEIPEDSKLDNYAQSVFTVWSSKFPNSRKTINSEYDPTQFIRDILISMLEAQAGLLLISNVTKPYRSALVKLAEIFSKQKQEVATAQAEKIKTDYAKMNISAQNFQVSDFVSSYVSQATGNAFEFLVSVYDAFGCSVIVGRDKIYIVPNTGFIKDTTVDSYSLIQRATTPTAPNVVYPTQYDSVTFNDNGYQDIRACAVFADENVGSSPTGNSYVDIIGIYQDTSTEKGSLLSLKLPKFMPLGADKPAVDQLVAVRKSIQDRSANMQVKHDADYFRVKQAEVAAATNELVDVQQSTFSNNWAQIKYLQRKYGDRTGSVNCFFNPKWAPGTNIRIYTKHPGFFIDGYVTSVVHRIATSAPNNGVAATTVNFTCGRAGTIPTGADKIELYDFNIDKARQYANEFITGVTTQ